MHYLFNGKLLIFSFMCRSDKSDLLQLKNTARKFEAREFERLVTRHLRQLHGGNSLKAALEPMLILLF